MARNPYFDILFEPVRIGPVTTKNRFYQVPHCSSMGYKMPNSLAGMRRMKAEGGWGVVNMEYCSIHPTSYDTPYPHASIWDDADIAANAMFLDFDKRKKDDMIHSEWVEYAWIIWSNYGLAINS